MDDNSIMSFGEHKGKRMEDVPEGWLIWLYGEIRYKTRLTRNEEEIKFYIEDSIDERKL